MKYEHVTMKYGGTILGWGVGIAVGVITLLNVNDNGPTGIALGLLVGFWILGGVILMLIKSFITVPDAFCVYVHEESLRVAPPDQTFQVGDDYHKYFPGDMVSRIGRTIVTWDFDPDELVLFHRNGGQAYVENRLQEILYADQSADLRQYQKALGIKILSQSGVTERKPDGVSLGSIIA
jgi:hypothetical protein